MSCTQSTKRKRQNGGMTERQKFVIVYDENKQLIDSSFIKKGIAESLGIDDTFETDAFLVLIEGKSEQSEKLSTKQTETKTTPEQNGQKSTRTSCSATAQTRSALPVCATKRFLLKRRSPSITPKQIFCHKSEADVNEKLSDAPHQNNTTSTIRTSNLFIGNMKPEQRKNTTAKSEMQQGITQQHNGVCEPKIQQRETKQDFITERNEFSSEKEAPSSSSSKSEIAERLLSLFSFSNGVQSSPKNDQQSHAISQETNYNSILINSYNNYFQKEEKEEGGKEIDDNNIKEEYNNKNSNEENNKNNDFYEEKEEYNSYKTDNFDESAETQKANIPYNKSLISHYTLKRKLELQTENEKKQKLKDTEPHSSTTQGYQKLTERQHNNKEKSKHTLKGSIPVPTLKPVTGCKKLHLTQAKNLLYFPARGREQDELPTVAIPDSFASEHLYKLTFTRAIDLEIGIELDETAKKIYLAWELYERGGTLGCRHQSARICTVKKEGPNHGRQFLTCNQGCFIWLDQTNQQQTLTMTGSSTSNSLTINSPFSSSQQPIKKDNITSGQRLLSQGTANSLAQKGTEVNAVINRDIAQFITMRSHVVTYFNSTLLKVDESWSGTPKQGRRNIDPTVIKKRINWYISIEKKEMAASYGKDDLWVLSLDNTFRDAKRIFIARSLFYGPTKEGRIRLKFLGAEPQLKVGEKRTAVGIHGPNASTELSMRDNLEKLSASSLPIFPWLINGEVVQKTRPMPLPIATTEPLDTLLKNYVTKYNLNEDQSKVLVACKQWANISNGDNHSPLKNRTRNKALKPFLLSSSQQEQEQNQERQCKLPFTSPDPIVLVHGVFGSGKSYLLSVLIIFLTELFGDRDNTVKILVAAATNTAVDRVLTGLLKLGFTNFVRVGSRKKIDKDLLPYTVFCEDAKEEKQTKCQMHETYKEFLEAKNERLDEQRAMIQRVRVVGVTCAASTFEVLDGIIFPVVVLDECSQMVEPLSLLPIGRSACQYLVAVGDPMQLRPVLLSTFVVKQSSEEGFAKTLFSRLTKRGRVPILLRTQYRCHPALSSIANRLFYAGVLRDGVTEADRKPLVPEWAPIVICDSGAVGSLEEQDGFDSYLNPIEAKLVLRIIESLLRKGVHPRAIGIVTLYKAQANKIRALMDERVFATKHDSRHSDQDSFSIASAPDDVSENSFDETPISPDDRLNETNKLGTPHADLRSDEPSSSSRNIQETNFVTTANAPKKTQSTPEKTAQAEENASKTATPCSNYDSDPVLQLSRIQISTVDAFQGAEKDIIIMSTVRTSRLGFATESKRLNVAITRARRHLVIVGSLKTLSENELWRNIAKGDGISVVERRSSLKAKELLTTQHI